MNQVEGAAPPAVGSEAGAAPDSPVRAARIAPVTTTERVIEMDVVRGFALLGILLMNIEYFTRPIAGMFFGLDSSLTGIDRAAGWLVMTFVQGKFYTLFSMLFGMGFALQAIRATERGARFGRLFLRRLLGLALIGAIHGYLIWSGDILLVYALTGGMMLLLFRKTPPSRLWKWAVAFVLLVSLMQFGMVAGMQAAPDSEARTAEMVAEWQADYDEAFELYSTGGYYDLFPQRVAEMNQQLVFLPAFGWNILAMFLLGAWLVRNGVMARPSEHLPLFRRFLFVGLAVGVPLAVVAMELGVADGMAEMTLTVAFSGALMLIASFALCFAYLGGFVLLAQPPAWRRRLEPVARAGRMALTNYLLQSVVATTLMYSYGFGLFGRVPRAVQVALTIVIWLGNVAFSHWWLGRYRFGPAEWFWRSMTYGQLPPMRRGASATIAG